MRSRHSRLKIQASWRAGADLPFPGRHGTVRIRVGESRNCFQGSSSSGSLVTCSPVRSGLADAWSRARSPRPLEPGGAFNRCFCRTPSSECATGTAGLVSRPTSAPVIFYSGFFAENRRSRVCWTPPDRPPSSLRTFRARSAGAHSHACRLRRRASSVLGDSAIYFHGCGARSFFGRHP
jgi:hypothetical protein